MDAAALYEITVAARARIAVEREERERAEALVAREHAVAFADGMVKRCAELALRYGTATWQSASFMHSDDSRRTEWREAAPDVMTSPPSSHAIVIWRPIVEGALALLKERRFWVQLMPERTDQRVYVMLRWEPAEI